MRSSKPILQCTAVRTEGGGLLAEESEMKAAGPIILSGCTRLIHPPAVELDVRGITIAIADPPFNCDPPSFVE